MKKQTTRIPSFNDECVGCGKVTPKKELELNSQFGGYEFKRICNNCADKLDAKVDAMFQSR